MPVNARSKFSFLTDVQLRLNIQGLPENVCTNLNSVIKKKFQIILLNKGQIEQQGDPWTIYNYPASVFASDFLGKANLLSGKLKEVNGNWYLEGEGFVLPVAYRGGKNGDKIKAAARGEYFEFCEAGEDGANAFALERKVFTGMNWKLMGKLGNQFLDISAMGVRAECLERDSDLFVKIRPEHVVYYLDEK